MSTPCSSWSIERANDWHQRQPFLIGCNYNPRTAINQLEMWQAETFDLQTIDQELGWAESLGFNSLRVSLHDLLWQQDSQGFLSRLDRFLGVAAKHKIGAMFVLFDSCWHPFPRLGKQRDPEPGVHNSGWVQSPGVAALRDHDLFATLQDYVTGVVSHFADDLRVQVWDIWNEPDNPNTTAYPARDMGDQKTTAAVEYLPIAFDWARAGKPNQPLTSAIWSGDWQNDETLKPFERLQLELSDIVTFHNYASADDLEKRILQLKRFNRPMLCTEYMARGNGSSFAGSLPVLKKHNVGAYNWGFVAGRSQTHYPWDSWSKYYDPIEPPLWFHEIFRPDGQPYDSAEVALIRSIAKP